MLNEFALFSNTNIILFIQFSTFCKSSVIDNLKDLPIDKNRVALGLLQVEIVLPKANWKNFYPNSYYIIKMV